MKKGQSTKLVILWQQFLRYKKIKRLPDDCNNIQYFETKFENKINRTGVKYIGIDMNNQSSALEDSWLYDNFNKPD